MDFVLLGNFVALLGAAIMVAAGLIKKKKKIIVVQCFQFFLQGLSNLLLGGFTGFLSAMLSILRNFVCLRREFTLLFKVAFILIQVILTCMFNSNGMIGLIPPVSTCLFTLFLDTKSEIILKRVIISTMLMWIVYDWYIHNYVSFAFDIGTIISNVIGIFALKKERASA